MKKILMILFCMIFMTACSGGTTNQVDNTVTPKLGDTVVMPGFEVTLVSYTVGKAIDSHEQYQDLIYLDVRVKNTSQQQTKFNVSKYSIYNQNNVKINSITNSKYTSSISNLAQIRPNGTAAAQIIFPFSGYGTYYIEFAGINGMVTAELDIKQY